MRDRLSTLIDFAKILGLAFDDGILIGWNVWPREPSDNARKAGAGQLFLDLWRSCSDLIRLGYVAGSPRGDRPEAADRLMAERLAYLVDRFEAVKSLLEEVSAGRPPCEADIIQTVRDVGRRLTTTPLILGHVRAGDAHGDPDVGRLDGC